MDRPAAAAPPAPRADGKRFRGAAENHLMNRHLGLFSYALLSGILLFSANVATVCGQTAPAAGAANLDAIKNATPAPAATINAYITPIVTSLASAQDGASATKLRDDLVNPVTPGKVAPSASFLNTYATSLDAAIAPALKNKSYEVRLNTAIAVARVAEQTDDAGLANATTALLNDESPFVALWGVKSARWVLPAMLRNPAANPNNLVAAILKAVSTHGSGPIGSAIVAEAYDALSIDYLNNNPKRKPSSGALTKVVPSMQQLLTQRVAAYKNGIPPEPLADQKATSFLSSTAVWPLHTPPQKLVSMQQMSDLVGLAAQQAQAAGPADRENLNTLVRLAASAIAVVPEAKPIQDQLQAAVKIDPRTPPAQVLQAVSGIPAALKGIKGFEALTPPPAATTGGGGEAPAPAGTQPSAATSTAPASTTP